MTDTEQEEQERRAAAEDLDAVWRPPAAATFVGVSENTLASWRQNRRRGKGEKGPDFVRLSRTRVGYRKRALVEWTDAREDRMLDDEMEADKT